ncbi:hypothetical protein EV182_005423 [Spiromyces aspiralis]|uniref:Uncharacterized protein n=1 Tax=Spiromyces aspiralis TaxID=68401 RepID=A0ACC1HAA1_9FUNG|nr:hypothetical protein EV182_005423 [Spiromyces aspiralis]
MLSDNRKKGGSSGTVAAVVGGQTCATLDGGEENPEFASVPLTHTTTPATTLASSADCRHRGYSASASVESGGEEEEKKEGKADAPSTAIPSLFGQSGDVTASAAHSEQGKPEDDNGTLSLSVHDAEDQIQRSIFFVECQYGCKRRCCHQSKRHLLDTGVGGSGRKSSSELRPYALILFGAGFCMGIGAGIWYLHHRSPSAVGGSSNVAAATGRIPPVDVASNAYQHRWFGYQVPPIPPVILAPT